MTAQIINSDDSSVQGDGYAGPFRGPAKKASADGESGEESQLTHPPHDELGILRPEINYCDVPVLFHDRDPDN